MRKIVIATSLAITLISGGALATGTYSLKTSTQVADALAEFVTTHGLNGLVNWFDSSLTCDKPGEMIYNVPGAPDDIGTRCHENGKIHIISGGINYGMIERLKTAGIPVDWLRSQLANPAALKAVYDLIGAEVINEAVRLSLRDKYAEHFVWPDLEGQSPERDRSQLSDHAVKYLHGFILRRISEAKPKDRPEIARIWGEIINEQINYVLVDSSLVPEIKTRR